MFKRHALLAIGLAFGIWMTDAKGEAQQNDAQTFLQERHLRMNRVLGQRTSTPAETANRNREVDRLIGELLDYEELSKRALAQHWEAHSVAERTEFVDLLRKLVERSYRRNIEGTLRYQITYDAMTSSGQDTVVHTRARSRTRGRNEPEIGIDYTMRNVAGGWKVVDVTTDGVSMVRNYRSQFARILSRGGWADLIRRMRNRLDSEEVM